MKRVYEVELTPNFFKQVNLLRFCWKFFNVVSISSSDLGQSKYWNLVILYKVKLSSKVCKDFSVFRVLARVKNEAFEKLSEVKFFS